MILSPKHFYQIASGAFTVILCKETSFISITVAATKPEFIYSTTESIKRATTALTNIGEMSTTIETTVPDQYHIPCTKKMS